MRVPGLELEKSIAFVYGMISMYFSAERDQGERFVLKIL